MTGGPGVVFFTNSFLLPRVSYVSTVIEHKALKPPVRLTPSGTYCIEGPSEMCTQSAEVWLAVSGGQPLFTLGLLVFALSLVDFLSLLWSPSTNINIFYLFFCQKYHLKDTHTISKNIHVRLKFEWGL